MFKTIRSILLLTLLAGAAQASSIYYVSLDTSNLSPVGTYFLGFQLANGDVAGDNLVSLTNFTFGGGSASGVPLTSDGASGSLSSGVTITDSGFANIFAEQFVPGSLLQFQMTFTTNLGGTPDQFVWSILDDTFTPIPTTSGDGLDSVLSFVIDSANPTISTFAASGGEFPAPLVTTDTGAATPEPSTLLLTGLGLAGLLTRRVVTSNGRRS